MNQLDPKQIKRVVLQFFVIFGASWLLQWSTGMDAVAALRASGGMAATWLLGNLQPTGGVVPSVEGLKKEST